MSSAPSTPSSTFAQLTDPATWLPIDPDRSSRVQAVVCLIIAGTLCVDLVLIPRPAAASTLLVIGVFAELGYAAMFFVRARLLDRGRGWPSAEALLHVSALVVLTVVIVRIDFLPPLLFLYLTVIVAVTFSFDRLARNCLTGLSLIAAGIAVTSVAPTPGTAVLYVGFMAATAMVAELRMEDYESADAERRIAIAAAERRAQLMTASARIRNTETDDFYDSLARGLVDLGFDNGQVMVELPDGRHGVAASTDPRVAAFSPAEPGTGLAGRVLETNQSIVLDDYDSWPGRLDDRLGVNAVVAVPIRCFGTPVAVLAGTRATVGTTPTADVEVVEAMALHAGAALENARTLQREREVHRQLRELDRMRDDLLSNVSHELRTPLQAIAGMGETLRRHGDQLTDDQAGLLLSRINANAERLRDRIDSLLSFSRFATGNHDLDRSPIDLLQFANGLVERISPALRSRSVEVVPPTGVDEPVTVLGDARLIEHVLENLITNAVQHTSSGLIQVIVRADGPTGGLRVCDEGGGLQEAEIDRVTERFYRGGHPDQRPESGLGLGLALAQAILEAHGTELVVANIERGACFGFDLPLAQSARVAERGTPRG